MRNHTVYATRGRPVMASIMQIFIESTYYLYISDVNTGYKYLVRISITLIFFPIVMPVQSTKAYTAYGKGGHMLVMKPSDAFPST